MPADTREPVRQLPQVLVMTEQPTLDALTQQRDREYLERLLAYRTRALTRVIAERDEARAEIQRLNKTKGTD